MVFHKWQRVEHNKSRGIDFTTAYEDWWETPAREKRGIWLPFQTDMTSKSPTRHRLHPWGTPAAFPPGSNAWSLYVRYGHWLQGKYRIWRRTSSICQTRNHFEIYEKTPYKRASTAIWIRKGIGQAHSETCVTGNRNTWSAEASSLLSYVVCIKIIKMRTNM